MKKNSKLFLFVLGLFFFSSCGYRFGQGQLDQTYRSISIPYVIGDQDGILTATLIKQFSDSSFLQYANCQADLCLVVKILDIYDENIGFRFDRKREGRLARSIIPTETRLTIEVELTLSESSSGKILRGPIKLQSCIEFDHDYYSSRDAVNAFSLGQLTDYDEAYDAAQKPLNDAIAKKIVDYVCQSW